MFEEVDWTDVACASRLVQTVYVHRKIDSRTRGHEEKQTTTTRSYVLIMFDIGC
jgi:hypothetical protein